MAYTRTGYTTFLRYRCTRLLAPFRTSSCTCYDDGGKHTCDRKRPSEVTWRGLSHITSFPRPERSTTVLHYSRALHQRRSGEYVSPNLRCQMCIWRPRERHETAFSRKAAVGINYQPHLRLSLYLRRRKPEAAHTSTHTHLICRTTFFDEMYGDQKRPPSYSPTTFLALSWNVSIADRPKKRTRNA
jgi:hypothetical protein